MEKYLEELERCQLLFALTISVKKRLFFGGDPRSRQRLCVCSGDEDAYGTQQKYKARRFVISDGRILGDFDKG